MRVCAPEEWVSHARTRGTHISVRARGDLGVVECVGDVAPGMYNIYMVSVCGIYVIYSSNTHSRCIYSTDVFARRKIGGTWHACVC